MPVKYFCGGPRFPNTSMVSLTPEKYGELRGRKLNIFERFSFNTSQRRMKKMLQHYEYGDEPNTLQKISWLLKGFLFGIPPSKYIQKQ
jgi:hypothetical protein